MKGLGYGGLAAGLALAVGAGYSSWARRWYLTWGATAQEVTAGLPGDELLGDPDLQSTRAISIGAPSGAVWPWLVQMGSGRGGAYTYDWIENLFGLGMHSADQILPQFQQLTVGDVLPLGPTGPGMRVEICEPGRAPLRRGRLGLELRPAPGRVRNAAGEPQPDRRAAREPGEPARQPAGPGARESGHGTADAARYQATRRANRR